MLSRLIDIVTTVYCCPETIVIDSIVYVLSSQYRLEKYFHAIIIRKAGKQILEIRFRYHFFPFQRGEKVDIEIHNMEENKTFFTDFVHALEYIECM